MVKGEEGYRERRGGGRGGMEKERVEGEEDWREMKGGGRGGLVGRGEVWKERGGVEGEE